MERYAVIEFKSAKFVKTKGDKSSKDGDMIITKNENRRRKTEELLDETHGEKSLIRTHQISAMLHVLLGCRPKSYFRPMYESSPIIDEIAERARVKITASNSYTKKNSDNVLLFEFTQGKKAAIASHKLGLETIDSNGNVYTKSYITWDSFRMKYIISINKIYYDIIIEFIEKHYGNIDALKKKMSLIDVLVDIRENESLKNEFLSIIKPFDVSPIKKILNGETKIDNFNNNKGYNLAAQTINTSCVYKTSIDGVIYVPVTKEIGNDLWNGIRYATIGDGGVAILREICDEIKAEEDGLYDGNFFQTNN